MNTVLVVVPEEALRVRLLAGLRDHSVFVAQSDTEALKTLWLIDIDVILRGGAGLPQELEAFIARVKEASPAALTVAIGAPGDETAAADFALPLTFGQRELDGALRHVADRLRLTREVAALRSSVTPRGAGAPTGADQPWEGAAFARVLKEFARAFAAGFDLPRALEMFLDAIGELVRPTRMALLRPGAANRRLGAPVGQPGARSVARRAGPTRPAGRPHRPGRRARAEAAPERPRSTAPHARRARRDPHRGSA